MKQTKRSFGRPIIADTNWCCSDNREVGKPSREKKKEKQAPSKRNVIVHSAFKRAGFPKQLASSVHKIQIMSKENKDNRKQIERGCKTHGIIDKLIAGFTRTAEMRELRRGNHRPQFFGDARVQPPSRSLAGSTNCECHGDTNKQNGDRKHETTNASKTCGARKSC